MISTEYGKPLPEEQQRWLDDLLARFARDWSDGLLASWAGALPPQNSLRRRALVGLVRIDLAQQWQRGRPGAVRGAGHGRDRHDCHPDAPACVRLEARRIRRAGSHLPAGDGPDAGATVPLDARVCRCAGVVPGPEGRASRGPGLDSHSPHTRGAHDLANRSSSALRKTRIWDVDRGNVTAVLAGSGGRFTPAGTGVVTTLDRDVVLSDFKSKNIIHRLKGLTQTVNVVAVSPDGRYGASATTPTDSFLRVWDLEAGTEAFALPGLEQHAYAVTFTPDSRRIITGGPDRMVRVWDLEQKKQVHVFRGHQERVQSLACSPGGRRVASGSYDRTVRIWQLPK